MKIYLDFDRTLFDCDRFIEDLYKILSYYNIPRKIFLECQSKCQDIGFNIYYILDLIKEKCQLDSRVYDEISKIMTRTNEYLYDDSVPFLKYLKSFNYDVIILSMGNNTYQQEKIFNSHIDSWYNKLIITMEHKGKLNLDFKNSIFIDDNPTEIESILSKMPKLIIRVERNNSKYENISLNSDILSVTSLGEIIDRKLL